MKKLELKPASASRAIEWPDDKLMSRGGDENWSKEKIRAVLDKRSEDDEEGPWSRLLNIVQKSCVVVDP